MNPQNTPPPAPSTDIRQEVITKLKEATNVLVTVSNNPTVDQLSTAIGFTLVLNKLKKHGTAVFSGHTPSTIEFLQPEKTLEKNTDSLQDFIIALDKAKADKLRYKIEDKYVKIFITPYRTSIGEKDLEFSQGDFNVDVVLAFGVKKREELDQAITAHGRILHDATVISINKEPGENIGSLNWNVPGASSYSEVMVSVTDLIKGEVANPFDQQIATAFLTGIVAETERFSNDKTTPQTMTLASILMKAGANQQLIATKLEEPEEIPQETPAVVNKSATGPFKRVAAAPPKAPEPPKPDPNGTLEVLHESFPVKPSPVASPLPDLSDLGSGAEPESEKVEEIHIDDQGILRRLEEMEKPKSEKAPNMPALPELPEEAPKLPSVNEPPQVPAATGRHILNSPPSGNNDPFTAITGSETDEETPSSELNLPSVNSTLLSHDGRPSHPKQPEPIKDTPPPEENPDKEPKDKLAENSGPVDLNGKGTDEDDDTRLDKQDSDTSTAPPVPPPMTPPAAQPPAGPTLQANAQAL